MAAMCGRYVVAYDPETLVSGFSVLRVPPFPKRWNVAPQSEVPVVHETREGERVVTLMRWGLLPHWARDPALANKLNNARAETVFDKPSFRQAIRRRRCLLPASGFYEWQATPGGKQPWYISRRDGAPFAMAGLFEAWRASEADDWRLSCCVVTTAPNALMAPIHDRMPVMVAREDWARWLDRERQDGADIAPLLVPCDPADMQAWPVAREVNRGRAEGPALVEPIAQVG
jgi:putative SOS response-associated peptidase YedK